MRVQLPHRTDTSVLGLPRGCSLSTHTHSKKFTHLLPKIRFHIQSHSNLKSPYVKNKTLLSRRVLNVFPKVKTKDCKDNRDMKGEKERTSEVIKKQQQK